MSVGYDQATPSGHARSSAAMPVSTLAAGNFMTMLFLWLIYTVAYYDRLLMVVLAHAIKAQFLLSDKQLALLTGAAFMIFYAVAGLIVGWLADRFSRRAILAGAIALWSVATMALGFAGSFLQLFVARAAIGTGQAAAIPVGLSIISDRYTAEKRPMATAIFYTGALVGLLGAFAIGGWIATNYGWRTALLIAGPPGLVLAVLTLFVMPEPARETLAPSADGAAKPAGWGLLFSDAPVLWTLLGQATCAFASIGMMQWLPLFFMRRHGMSLEQIGLFFGPVLAAGMLVGLLSGGAVGNWLARRSPVAMLQFAAWTTLAVSPIYVAAFLVSSLPVALFATFVATIVTLISSPSFTAASQTICDPRIRGRVAGFGNLITNLIGGAMCPLFVGVLSDWWSPADPKNGLGRALIVAILLFGTLAALFFFRAAWSQRKKVRFAA